MQYYSLNKGSVLAGFREAAVNGQGPDGGLYFPRFIPKMDAGFLRQIKNKSKTQIAYEIARPYVGTDLPEEILFEACARAVDFNIPLVRLDENVFSLELFHGPTLAFKDVGARFMSACLAYYFRKQKWKVTILVATSGDTGSAVANAFYGIEGVEVVILYPSGKVSSLQETQMTTLGKNITAVEVMGTFDDCQRMVKQAFVDKELNEKLYLSSANSINIARWLPQQFYYYYALQQWPFEEPPVISVPSGNLGNLCAGLLAHAGGLPVKHFIAACNANDVFTEYLHSGYFSPKPAVQTLSNAMDVGNPSNFHRVLNIFQNDHLQLRGVLSSFSINDELTTQTISNVFQQFRYVCDPHGAVAYYMLSKHLEQHPGRKGIFLETAHPAKFKSAVEAAIASRIKVPASLSQIIKAKKRSLKMTPDFKFLKEFLYYEKQLV